MFIVTEYAALTSFVLEIEIKISHIINEFVPTRLRKDV